MDDADKLLHKVLSFHYRDRPTVVTDAMAIIQSYSNKEQKTDYEYDEILRTLHDLMTDLPHNILLYFLTKVPSPQPKDNSTSVFSDLMRRSRATLLDSIKSVLTEYLNNASVPPLIVSNLDENDTTIKQLNCDEHSENEIEPSSKFKQNTETISKKVDKFCCNSLLEICAEYVVSNLSNLEDYYQHKNKVAWKLITTNTLNKNSLKEYYKYIEDLNRKRYLLRMIVAGHVPMHTLKEIYGPSEIFLRERNLCNIINEDAFSVSHRLEEAIETFISS